MMKYYNILITFNKVKTKLFKISLLFGLLLFVSCSKKIEIKETQYQEVSISINGVQTGRFTKASSSSILNVIEEMFPTSGVTFKLTSTTNSSRVYNIALGESLSIPLDTYTVTARYKPYVVGNTFKNGEITQSPRFSVESTITVTSSQSNYVVDAIYQCWALVIDYTVCSKYRHLGYSYSEEDFTYFATSGNLGIAFINGEWTDSPYTITAVPKSTEFHEPKTYSFVSNRNYDGIYVENGKWYCLNPESVATTSGDLSINYPKWTEGSIE